MGPGAQVGSRLGIHWLHLISQGNKATNHWDLSTWRNLMPRGSHGELREGTESLCQKNKPLTPIQVGPGKGYQAQWDGAGRLWTLTGVGVLWRGGPAQPLSLPVPVS